MQSLKALEGRIADAKARIDQQEAHIRLKICARHDATEAICLLNLMVAWLQEMQDYKQFVEKRCQEEPSAVHPLESLEVKSKSGRNGDDC